MPCRALAGEHGSKTEKLDERYYHECGKFVTGMVTRRGRPVTQALTFRRNFACFTLDGITVKV